MYTHTYYDSTQAGPDDISLLEANSQQEVELQIQHLELQANVNQTASQIVSEADEETGDVMRATALKSLLFHVKINSIADYYDIPELRHRANTEVQKILNTSWSPCNFPIIIQEAFNSSGDKELRNILSETMAAHIDGLVELGEEISPPEAISDFTYDVLRRLVAVNKSRIEDLESQLREARRTVRAHESMKENIEKFRALYNNNTERHDYTYPHRRCVEFDMERDIGEDPPLYKLRCKDVCCRREYYP